MNKKVLVFGISYNVNPKYNKFDFLKTLNQSELEDIVVLLPDTIPEELANVFIENKIEYYEFNPFTGEIEGYESKKSNFNVLKEDSVNKSLTFFSKRDNLRTLNMSYNISDMYNLMKNFYQAVESFVEQNNFKYCITWGASPYSLILDDVFTQNGSYVTYLEQGYFRNYGIQTSSVGSNYQGEILADYLLNEFDSNYTNEQIDYYFSTKFTPAGEKENAVNKRFVRDNEYIFVPMQINVDTQIILNSHYIKNMEQLIQESIQLVKTYNDKNNTDLKLLVKVHPWHSFQDLLDNYGYLAQKYANEAYFVETGDLEYLLYNAKAVITINSTVGIQALDMYKKVMCLGNAIYSVPELVYMPNDKSEYYQVFEEMMLDDGKKKSDVDRFLQYLYFNKHTPMKNYQFPTIEEIDNFYKTNKQIVKSYININNNVTNITEKVVCLHIENTTSDPKQLKFGDSIEKEILPGKELEYKFFAPKGKVVNINTFGLDYTLTLEDKLNDKYGEIKTQFYKGKTNSLKVYFNANDVDTDQDSNHCSSLYISSTSNIDVVSLMLGQDGKPQNDKIVEIITEYRNSLDLYNENITFIGSGYYAYLACLYSYIFTFSQIDLIDPNLNINSLIASLSEDVLFDLKTTQTNIEIIDDKFMYLKGCVRFNQKQFRDLSTMNTIKSNSDIKIRLNNDKEMIVNFDNKSEKLHICFLAHEFPVKLNSRGEFDALSCGGIGAYILKNSVKLAQYMTVSIVAEGIGLTEEQSFEYNGVNINLTPQKPLSVRYLNAYRKLRAVNEKCHVDIIEITDSFPLIERAFDQQKVTMRLHNSLELINFIKGDISSVSDITNPFSLKKLSSYQYADTFVGVSKYITNETARFLPAYAEKLTHHIYNGIEAIEVEEIECDKKAIFCHGTKNELKNIGTILDIFEELYSLDNEYKLYLIGRGVEYTDDLILSKNLTSNKNIHNIDTMTNEKLISTVKSLGIYISASKIEAHSIALLEALALGKPQILSNIDSFIEVAKEANTAVFFEHTEKPAAIAARIDKTFKNEKTYLEMQRNSLELSQKFLLDNIIEENVQYYKDLVKEN